ncbi:MAG: ATP-binding protein [Steroidobacteraceae bacterium]
MNTHSLSFRLVAWYAGVLTVAFVLLGGLTWLFLRHDLERNVLGTQLRRARQIADTLVSTAGASDRTRLAQLVEQLYAPEANDRFIRISRADGPLVYVSGIPRDQTFDPAGVPPPAAGGAVPAPHRQGLADSALLIAAVGARGSDGARYLVEVGTSSAGTEATLAHVLVMLAVSLPAAVCVALAGGFVLVRRALKPVASIARKAEDISLHNLSERLPVVQSGDEIEQLSVALNRMIRRLEDAVRGSKQFVADASHELRTPLTVMRGELESLAQDAALGGETRETLGSVLEEVDRLGEIVDGLFALSRLDAGEAPAERVRFDLGELAATTAGQMSLLAEDKRVSVSCESAGGVTVEGDRARLKQVVVNLLDNAIKYTPSGGHVRLAVRREAGFAVLEVSDNGIGIPADALPHVFQRFFRVDSSRSREQGGAGLGLSIVKSICSAHGAEVDVSSSPGEGSTFRIRQPLAAGPAAPA